MKIRRLFLPPWIKLLLIMAAFVTLAQKLY